MSPVREWFRRHSIAMLDRHHAVRWYYRRTVPSQSLDIDEVLAAARSLQES